MATKQTTKEGRDPRKDVFYIHLDQIKVIEGYNCREDFSGETELADSIEANGVKVPLRGYKKDGIYYLTDGERRYRAAKSVEKRTGHKLRVPFLPNEKGTTSEEQGVLDMLLFNSGKKLNPVEEATAITRLINFGYSEAEIRKQTGFSRTYVCNLKLLGSAPKKVRDLIVNNTITSTLAMKIFREEKDFAKAQSLIEGAVVSASKEGKTKVTGKTIDKHKGGSGINSYSALRKSFRLADKKGLVPRQDKMELYEFAKKIHSGEFAADALLEELYEPVKVEEVNPQFELEEEPQASKHHDTPEMETEKPTQYMGGYNSYGERNQ